ncbi:MAG: hypothetical protein QM756_44450 [Polyangiaceae bacterium]
MSSIRAYDLLERGDTEQRAIGAGLQKVFGQCRVRHGSLHTQYGAVSRRE